MNVRQMFHVKHRPYGDEPATTWRQLHNGVLLAVLVLEACFATPAAAQDEPEPEPEAEVLPPGTVTFKDAETRTVAGSEVTRDFSYAWPAEVAAVPALVRRFTAERAEMLAEQKIEFIEGLSFAEPEGCFGCNRDLARDWSVFADTPRFLVLQGSYYIYSGGAHGNTIFDTLVWDRKAKKAFDSRRMFVSKSALQAALGAAWCEGLKAERAARWEVEVSEVTLDDSIFPCPPIADLQLYPASSDGQRFDRITLLAAPYIAGSYAEGVYEVTLPVTPAVLAAIKPRYRAAFTLSK
jgi:hypothetical protein